MAKVALDTPPSSDIEATTAASLPPSPPQSPPSRKGLSKRRSLSTVEGLLGTLKLWRRGKLDGKSDWLTFRLSESECAEFQERLSAQRRLREWYGDKARCDWDSATHTHVLRMPTATHERLVACVETAVQDGIEASAAKLEASGDGEGAKAATELRKVYAGRSTTLSLEVPQLESSSQESQDGGAKGKAVLRSPDATFFHPSQPELPMLVIEVAHSQSAKDLSLLAESYVIDSSHRIQAVVGFKVPYIKTAYVGKSAGPAQVDKTASVSLWRPSLESIGDDSGGVIGTCSVECNGPFRNAHGEATSMVLDLKLSDLLPVDVLDLDFACLEQHTISIPLDPMADLLTNLESEPFSPGTSFTSDASASNTKRKPIKFRKRKRTPPTEDELDDSQPFDKDDAADEDYVDEKRNVRRRKSARMAARGVEDVALRSSARQSREAG